MAETRKPKREVMSKLRILPFFLIIAYILFILVKTVWQNQTINREINNLETNISDLREKNKQLENLNKYYQSNEYKEQEARLKLGYQKPGEKVYVLPNQGKNQETQSESSNNSENKDTRPNYLKWWEYLFR